MPDNWGFVAAAYGLALIVMVGYWRRLCQRERALAAPARRPRLRGARRSESDVERRPPHGAQP